MTPAQLELRPAPPDPLADLAPVEHAEARIACRRREDLADALNQTATCSCGGLPMLDDGDWLCALCAKPSEARR